MAIWVMAVVAVAPCQCFSPGGIQTTSPGRISSTGPSQRCTRPQPAVTIRVWPSGWVCHAVRAPGSNVTLAPTARLDRLLEQGVNVHGAGEIDELNTLVHIHQLLLSIDIINWQSRQILSASSLIVLPINRIELVMSKFGES